MRDMVAQCAATREEMRVVFVQLQQLQAERQAMQRERLDLTIAYSIFHQLGVDEDSEVIK